MKKSVLFTLLLLVISVTAYAQKFALIDTEYILENISAYQDADEQLQEATKKYQAEIEAKTNEVKKLYDAYTAELSTYSVSQKTKKEDEIIAKEKECSELQRKYFGPEGELAKMREELINPIQDDIYEVVKEISQEKGYDLVLDRATAVGVIFANPRIDISDDVLNKLGYSN